MLQFLVTAAIMAHSRVLQWSLALENMHYSSRKGNLPYNKNKQAKEKKKTKTQLALERGIRILISV